MRISKVVVDTNLIFSALISKNSSIREFLLDEQIVKFAPNFLIIELFKHKNKIRSITQLEESDFLILFSSIIEKINLFLFR